MYEMQRSRPSGAPVLFSGQSWICRAIPAIFDWGRLRGDVANLLLFGLTALLGEWTVHQIAYLITYRSHFGLVMASTPHRLYMAQAGLVLVVLAVAAAFLAAVSIWRNGVRERRLSDLLPLRLPGLLRVPAAPIPVAVIARTAIFLAAYQIALYLLQENVEASAAGLGWPGLAVLLPPDHAIVVPLHLLIATLGALLLWTVSSQVLDSRRVAQAIERLVRLLTRYGESLAPLTPACSWVPNQRRIAGRRCLRSPPYPV
jgi:hypothetical protein